ncbi:unnamed protein product [Effrenium voratum]|nr:unnamed protein product [Effrenium voratum]
MNVQLGCSSQLQCFKGIFSYKKFWHIVALSITVGLYGRALIVVDGSRSFTTAAWQQILDNLFPDESSDAMRLAEREVVPAWQITMQADDVTKALNAFQTFCWFKHGMDDHLGFVWSCDIKGVGVVLSKDDRSLGSMNCSKDFVDRHLRDGDDPRCVPWGADSIPSLGLEVDPSFDEYEIHGSSPMLAPLSEKLAAVDQRLAAIEARLNISVSGSQSSDCAAIARGCPKSQKPASLPEDFPCSCFQGNQVLSACRNHHWGLLHLCRPLAFHVSFLIFHESTTSFNEYDRFLEWFLVRMSFERVNDGHWSGFYRSRLELHEERALETPWTRSFVTDGLLATGVLLAMTWFIAQSLGTFLFFLPQNLCALVALKRDEENQDRLVPLHVFKDHLSRILVGRASRLKWVNHFEAVMELIISAMMIAGVLRSIFNGDACSTQHCRVHYGLKQAIEKSYVLFLDDDPCHGTAWLLLYVTIVFASLSMFDQLRWLPSVILLCAKRILMFLLAYGLLLCGFGIGMYIAFGPRFAQFATPVRSCSELFFLTCGMPMAVFDDLHPFQDSLSTEVAFMLALYGLFMSIIGLNFFTMIILDAYAQARDIDSADAQLQLMGDDVCRTLMALLGLQPESGTASPALLSTSGSSASSEAELQETLVPRCQSV